MSELELDDQVDESVLYIPTPLPHQLGFHLEAARFKTGRFGRRWGKSREAFIGATVGHGPEVVRSGLDGDLVRVPLFPGILTPPTRGDDKRDVVWIGKNNKQTAQIWLEEVMPRFKDVGGVAIDQVDRIVAVEGHGSLHIRSAEAIDSVRGIGARIRGIICDEAAHFPFLRDWRAVLRPIAMDNEAWAMIFSTTNGGPDGELNEIGDKISPSGFNRLCLEIMQGSRTYADGWYHQHGTGRENRKIKPAEFELTLKEYPEGSISRAQEMEAQLVSGGAGVAFPEWRDALHVVRMEPPPGAVWFGGMDWGYHPHPAVFVAAAAWGDRQIHYRHERVWRETTPYTVGFELGQDLLRRPALEWIACDPSMGANTTGESIMEGLQRGLVDAFGTSRPAPVVIEAPRGEGQRRTRKLLLHQGLAYEERTKGELWLSEGLDPDDLDPLEAEEKVVPQWLRPQLTFHPDCTECCASIPILPRDPKAKEDVDTKAYDHPYDAVTYPLNARAQQDRRDPVDQWQGVSRDHDPGRTKAGQRVDPFAPPKPHGREPYRTGFRWKHDRDDSE